MLLPEREYHDLRLQRGTAHHHHVEPCPGGKPQHLRKCHLGAAKALRRWEGQHPLRPIPGLSQRCRRTAGDRAGGSGGRPAHLPGVAPREIHQRHCRHADGGGDSHSWQENRVAAGHRGEHPPEREVQRLCAAAKILHGGFSHQENKDQRGRSAPILCGGQPPGHYRAVGVGAGASGAGAAQKRPHPAPPDQSLFREDLLCRLRRNFRVKNLALHRPLSANRLAVQREIQKGAQMRNAPSDRGTPEGTVSCRPWRVLIRPERRHRPTPLRSADAHGHGFH